MIFVDASVPRTVADAVKRVRPDARWKLDLLPCDTKDEVWLEAAGKQGWLVLTRDKHVRTRPGKRRAPAGANFAPEGGEASVSGWASPVCPLPSGRDTQGLWPRPSLHLDPLRRLAPSGSARRGSASRW